MRTHKASHVSGVIPLFAAVIAALAVFTLPARSESGFPAERLMTWYPGERDDAVPYVSGFLVSRDGSIYVGTQGYVRKFASNGRFLLTTRPQLDCVSRFAVDSKGCIYVVHGAGAELISKFDAKGLLLSGDPTEAGGRGGFGSERLAFDAEGSLVSGEVLSFADQVAVECVKHRISLGFRAMSLDNKDRLHVLIDERNPYAAGSAIFDTDGYLLGVGPGSVHAIRFDRAGREYVFCSLNSVQVVAVTMYSPAGAVLPISPMLPAEEILLPRVPSEFSETPEEGKFVEAAPPLYGWSVDDSGNFYCCGSSKRETPTELSTDRVIYSDLYVFKMDPAGHVLARSSALPESPDDPCYEPQIDGQGRVYYLEYYPDRIELMRGTFAP